MNARCELWDAATAAAVDRHSIDVVGMPSPVLMERAALACSDELVALRRGSALPVVVVCGPGNNGGDGYAIARQLHGWGVDVTTVAATAQCNAEAAAQAALARACGVPRAGLAALPTAAIVVDACLGTGARGAPRGELAAALERMHAVLGPRLAVDVPSGVEPDRGFAHPHAVVADVTVTFGRSKPGLHVTPGRAHAGRVVVADIGLVAPATAVPAAMLLDPVHVRAMLRPSTAPRHKGDRGHVGIRGGGPSTPGAVVLATLAAFRTGAGLVTIASDDATVRAAVAAHRPEAMFAAVAAHPAAAAHALVVGPGLTEAADQAALPALWASDARGAIWDASALAAVTAPATAPRVITPHPGEAARLLVAGGFPDAAAVQGDRLAAARALVQRSGATVVLKGEGTIVADATRLAIVTLGGPGLATAGSGDVLAGMVGALLARGMDPWQAACAAAVLHAAAGDVAARRHAGTHASDVIDAIDAAYDHLDTPAASASLPRWRPS